MESVNTPGSGSAIGSLREEIRQSVPFPSVAVEATLTIQRAADDLNAAFAALLKEHEITVTQYNALRIIRGSGERGLSTHEVGARLIKRESDVPRLLERMVAAGLVKRERNPDDRRVTSCMITPEARALLERLEQPVYDLHERIFAGLSREEREVLVRLLDRVRAAVREG
jgi:DNA-binding MarR family transcriptional regulator